jgi:hypothetical protein
MLSPGQRIRLISMPDDPDPIPYGTKGTVESTHEVGFADPFTQVHVKWDNGRTLSLAVPPDYVEVIE